MRSHRSPAGWTRKYACWVSLALRNLLFTIVVPAAGAVYAPWWILTHSGADPQPVAWSALILVAAPVRDAAGTGSGAATARALGAVV